MQHQELVGFLLCGGEKGWRECVHEFFVGFVGCSFAVVFGDEQPLEGFLAVKVGGGVHTEDVTEIGLRLGFVLQSGFEEPVLGFF